MPRLRIDYEAQTAEAVVSTEASSRVWEAIIRTVRERTDEAEVIGGVLLRMPWWAFLTVRKALAYQIASAPIDVEFSDAATALLESANVREGLLGSANSIAEISDEKLDKALKKGGFARALKEFQIRNLRKLCRLPVGATFSVPGSGKTTEALAFLTFNASPSARLLVVAPKNAFAAWEEQLSICLPGRQFERLIGGKDAIAKILTRRDPRYMLITYEQFPRVADVLATYLSRFDAFLFLDESHRIKGGLGKVRARAILKVGPVAKFRLVMSGTPLPNSTADLVPQFAFIAPELETENEDSVKAIQPFFVRTTKRDLELPPTKEILIPLRMNEQQRQLYQLLRSQMARDAKADLGLGARRAFRQIGRSAIRLLQFVSNPALLAGKLPDFDEFLGAVIEEGDSPKLDWACRRARQLARQGMKVIIWSSFVENVELLAERLEEIGADYIHGGVDASSDAEAESREAKVKRFHDDANAMVLVANPAACGEGISLHTVCDHAIYVDRNYNAAQYLQSVDRIHRIGSDAQKYVEIVTCPDTIDDSVGRRLELKANRMAEVLNDSGLKISPISIDPDQIDLDEDDIYDLLSHLSASSDMAA